MRIGKLEITQNLESRNDKTLGIQTYSYSNDYPQKVINIVGASCTGSSCYSNYRKFIIGQGFADKTVYQKKINRKRQTLDYILEQTASDLAMFGGFALHINYNANFKISEIQHIPFEHIRFEKMDDDGNFSRVAIHTDWAKQFTSLRKWDKKQIEFIDFYNPNPEEIAEQVESVGGWNKYKGQVYYFSNKGDKVYPLPVFAQALTDMNTEEAISDIVNRNATKNFFPAGMLIDRKNKSQSDEQSNEIESSLIQFQGSKNASKIMYIEVGSDEEKPEFVPFRSANYDKEFTVSREAARDNIGRSFNQPPILRSEDVGANFGADLMTNAYNYYNSITKNERTILERVFSELLLMWWQPFEAELTIVPAIYE